MAVLDESPFFLRFLWRWKSPQKNKKRSRIPKGIATFKRFVAPTAQETPREEKRLFFIVVDVVDIAVAIDDAVHDFDGFLAILEEIGDTFFAHAALEGL